MNIRDQFFKGQQANETLICFTRHHWICLFREFLYFIIFVTLFSIAIFNTQSIREILVGGQAMKLLFATSFLISTFYLHRFFIKMLNFFVDIAIFTDVRIIEHQRTIFFKDTMDSIDLAQIQNIERYGDGLLPTLFGYGELKIFLSASSTVKTFSYIPNVQFHFRCISRLKEARQNQLFMPGDKQQEIDIDKPIHEISEEISKETRQQQALKKVQEESSNEKSLKKPFSFKQ